MFGRYGWQLYELARGTDDNPVVPNRPTKSVSAEDTFQQDLPLSETEALIRPLAQKAWTASGTETRVDGEPNQLFRLAGVGLSNFQEPEKASAQPDLSTSRVPHPSGCRILCALTESPSSRLRLMKTVVEIKVSVPRQRKALWMPATISCGLE
jgi:hypothetical protein